MHTSEVHSRGVMYSWILSSLFSYIELMQSLIIKEVTEWVFHIHSRVTVKGADPRVAD